MTMKFRGYHDCRSLPVKVGQRVRVLKGTRVESTNPSKPSYTTKRAQIVVVRSLGPGQSYSVGHDRPEGRYHSLWERDVDTLKKIYGTSDPKELLNHPEAIIQDGVVYLPVKNPTVLWAGSGGYWCEVDLNLVEVIE